MMVFDGQPFDDEKFGEIKGDLKVYAKADGLEGDMLIIPLK